MQRSSAYLVLLLISQVARRTLGFTCHQYGTPKRSAECSNSQLSATSLDTTSANIIPIEDGPDTSRRRMIVTASFAPIIASLFPLQANAAQRQPLNDLLYRILRVREATQQETRLIKSGKFKDVQRANVKLAVRFMIENYRLNDAFVGASSYLDGNNKRIEAGQIGQSTVQNLYTILEYFDSSDVENIKVGATNMAGKEEIVLRGLDATKKGIDDFLTFFPSSDVDLVRNLIEDENRLNEKEFDSNLGQIVNLPTKS